MKPSGVATLLCVLGEGRFSAKAFGDKFAIWSAPPRPPKFDNLTGLTVWRNVQ
jgi:hypothetical protein